MAGSLSSSSLLTKQMQSNRLLYATPSHPAVAPSARLYSRSTALRIEARQAEAGMGIYGTKAGMTQIYKDNGACLAATVIAIDEGNIVTQVKTPETDGYGAIQIGYEPVKPKNIRKPEMGHLEKAGAPPLRHLREFKIPNIDGYQPGQQLNFAEMFSVGDMVDVAGTSIGKGFQGAIKRHNHKRGSMTHGSKSKRQHGSIGSATTPSRVFPGLKMAGQMGNERKKIRHLEVLMVDAENKALVVKGAIPGKPGNVVEITPAKYVGKNC